MFWQLFIPVLHPVEPEDVPNGQVKEKLLRWFYTKTTYLCPWFNMQACFYSLFFISLLLCLQTCPHTLGSGTLLTHEDPVYLSVSLSGPFKDARPGSIPIYTIS